MNLRFLEAFYWVATLGSVTRAAEKLTLTQAGVSSRIASLEQEMKTQLFDRHDRRLTISPAGQRLLPHAKRMLNMERDIRRDLDVADPGLPVLRLGSIETVTHTWLLPLLGALQVDLADTELELTIENTPLLEQLFRRGILDIAILASPAGGDGIRYRALPPLEMVFVQRRDDAQGDAVAVPLPELAERQILTFQRGSPTQGAMMDLFGTAGVTPHHVHGISSLSAMLRLVESGFGTATLPRDMVEPLLASRRLQLIETPQPLPSLPLFVIYRDDPSSVAIASVVESIVAIANDHNTNEPG
jgi:DNA-binding transcriptional LysR family regulator